MKLTWLDAIQQVLRENGSAMNYNDIADTIVTSGLVSTVGATPRRTVSGIITTNINDRGSNSNFIRVASGVYKLRPDLYAVSAPQTAPKNVANPPQDDEQITDATERHSAIKALGMHWRRDIITWGNSPALWGVQLQGSERVNFCEQRGIYLLHYGRDTVYIGRVTGQALGSRLYQHTRDRLNGRWDRFSWFGLRDVEENGALKSQDTAGYEWEQVVYDLEAVLIEAAEPPLNRRRGDGLTAVEYVQYQETS